MYSLEFPLLYQNWTHTLNWTNPPTIWEWVVEAVEVTAVPAMPSDHFPQCSHWTLSPPRPLQQVQRTTLQSWHCYNLSQIQYKGVHGETTCFCSCDNHKTQTRCREEKFDKRGIKTNLVQVDILKGSEKDYDDPCRRNAYVLTSLTCYSERRLQKLWMSQYSNYL